MNSSAFSQAYYPYDHNQQQLHVQTNGFPYGHDDGRAQNKTPTSMINHPRHSPGPLSTPPSHSRNASQPPPDHAPAQLIRDDSGGSLSDSPSSIPTPDNDSIDFEMLDAENFFNPNQTMAITSMQIPQEQILATDDLQLSDHTIFSTFNAVIASQGTQTHHYPPQSSLSTHPSQPMASSQPFNQGFGMQYTAQPPYRDPWTSQRPQQNPNEPRSGGVVFDPASDPTDYSAFVNFDVGNWTSNNTDPNYLVSPNEPLAPHEAMFDFPHTHYQQVHQNQSPVEMRVTVPSPPPPGGHPFYNFNPSQFLSEGYSPDSQFPSSPDTSAMGSSIGQLPQSPSYQTALSPHASLPSPGGSDMISSYQHSDPGMVVDSYLGEQFEAKPLTGPSSVIIESSPTRTIPEVTLDPTPEPESISTESTVRSHSRGKGSGRPGGRALGTHLEPKVAKAAHDMRKTVACWHCVLQRDKCGPGDTCERCMKRSQRPNADCGLGCSRVKLIELAQYFLPTLVTQMHEDSNLTHFVSQYIRQWMNQEIVIYMTCGQDNMPRIPVKVYEFIPKGDSLLVQLQYVTDPQTKERYPVKKESPALGMVHINHNEEKKYDRYITDIVDNHLDAFGELCWAEEDNDFQQKLFKLMTRVKPKSDDESKLLREVFRLIVCTFIMSHTLTIAEESKHTTLANMRSYAPASYIPSYTSPRMTNRQLKYFFSKLHRTILSTVLNKLQQIFKSSKGCDKWLAAFVSVVGMCMAMEDQQMTIHCVMETKARTEGTPGTQAHADIACREIDGRMNFISQIFRWKYNRKCNPLRDCDIDWEKEAGFGDETSVAFVRQVAQLVKDNIDYLQQKQGVSIASANQSKYTSRLVGQFLLSFWYPT